jgi:hypothetical protein
METTQACGLKPCHFGTALGLVWALSVFLMGMLTQWMPNYFGDLVQGIGHFYVGYTGSWVGALIGALWGFVDMFIFGFLVAWVYNRLQSCCCKC